MENTRQNSARTRSHGSGTPGKSAQPHDPATRHGSPARIDAAVSHKLTSNLLLLLDPPPAIDGMQGYKNDHREINPAAPGDVFSWQGQSQDKRNDSDTDRDAPTGYLIDGDQPFICI
jgi:hypothetical protein